MNTIRNAVHFTVTMCEAARLRFDAFEERLDEIGEASEAVGRKVIFAIEGPCRRSKMGITQARMIHSVQMPI